MGARITILPDETIGTISPNLYGHFIEHLGACVNGGIWVGEESAIPNTAGLRDDVLEAFRRIRPSILRWPGGCFADDYHWRDGVVPRRERPTTVNLWWGHSLEDNAFGTHEFINLCRLIGAEPYLAGNLGNGGVREMREWVEYCNFERASTLAKQRAANGSPTPFGVRCWGVGNEAWGCGGNFCPEDYVREYRRYATYLHDMGGTPLYLIACGPDGNQPDWTRKLFRKLATADRRFNCRIHALAAHYYSGTAGTATEFSTDQWYELLQRAAAVEQLIVDQRAAMDEFDPERKIDLVIDEWGTWHPPTPGRDPKHLWQQNTMRDALVAAITLDAFSRRCDVVKMAALAQAANVLQALFLTEGDRMVLTPTYHVFDLYKEHQGGRGVRMEIESPMVAFAAGDQRGTMAAVAGSASMTGRTLTLSMTNVDARRAVEVGVEVRGAVGGIVSIDTIAHEDVHAHNTFERPEEVKRMRGEHVAGGRALLPAGSVTVVSIRV